MRHGAIAFHERRLNEDPHSALDMAQLAALQMEHGRMTGDERAFVQAESLALRSLAERTRKNGRSAALRVNALLAQHRFVEAATAAKTLVESEPDEPAYRALLAETLLEIGDYDDAIRQLGTIRDHRANLGIAPRFARWAELTGRVGDARRILERATEEARTRFDLTAEQRTWYVLRLADLELRYGNLRSAARAIEAGLRASPEDWRLLLARARLSAARGSWTMAARGVEDVLARVPSIEAIALLSSVKVALGQRDEAQSLRTVLEAFLSRPGSLHRSWALRLLDEGISVDAVTRAVVADTLVRRDVYTLDLLAWALFRAGQTGEALAVIRRAVRLGTRDPVLQYHAGMIEWSAGDQAVAQSHFKDALGGRLALSPEQVREIRRASRGTSTRTGN